MRITLGESIRVVLCRGVLFRRGGVMGGRHNGAIVLKKERERYGDIIDRENKGSMFDFSSMNNMILVVHQSNSG